MVFILKYLFIISSIAVVVLPSAIGWWYISSGNQAFSVPFEYWIIPFIYLLVFTVLIFYK